MENFQIPECTLHFFEENTFSQLFNKTETELAK